MPQNNNSTRVSRARSLRERQTKSETMCWNKGNWVSFTENIADQIDYLGNLHLIWWVTHLLIAYWLPVNCIAFVYLLTLLSFNTTGKDGMSDKLTAQRIFWYPWEGLNHTAKQKCFYSKNFPELNYLGQLASTRTFLLENGLKAFIDISQWTRYWNDSYLENQ